MSEIRLNINGLEVRAWEGQTVLEAAGHAGIDIPTLCHDDRVKMYGSCGICVVEAEGSPRLLRSCSTLAADGMVIFTDTARVRKSRKSALELLLSDHTGDCRPPCVLACPAQTDCQGYVGLIANGEYKEALKLVKDKIPLPGSIGKVCPHPCEEACRRQKVEEPISIASLKRFVADQDMQGGELYTVETAPDTGKKVAVIGGGPGGLSAAYFLRTQGHAVTIFDAMPEMGGMLRYGIPEYRLPKQYLQAEIDAIAGMGIKLHNNVKIGKDITLSYICDSHDAVIIAIGAWSSTALRCPGEDLEGVVGGIDFLRQVSLGEAVSMGRNVAVVGGGNTAMDCARTAVRLGAERVYNIYRRTKNEMPAETVEIQEAEEEGVIFKNLTNPIEVVGEDGKATRIRLQIMELGEPDASGRRAPVPVEGKEEILEIDTVIVAIGQRLDPAGFEAVELTKWKTISADEATFRTNLERVFAIGDATNKGADIAISAIGEAKKCAAVVDRYLYGEEARYEAPFVVTSDPEDADFAEYKKQPREKMSHRAPVERCNNFSEINDGYTEEQARREASRCLECGCHDFFECKLINYANQYQVQPQRLDGAVHNRKLEQDHPFITRNPDKCILCGLCVRICDEVIGASALGLVDRGFDTIVKPALDLRLQDTDCISCGQCVHVCPTGALTETMMTGKQVPVWETCTETVCSFCGVGCKTKLTHSGGSLLRSLPIAEDNRDALLCMKGRFGFGELGKLDRFTVPMRKNTSGEFRPVSYDEACVFLNKSLQSVQARHGADSVAVAVSDRYTNEEILLIREYAREVLRTDNVFSFGMAESGLAQVLGRDGSTAGFEELEATGLILVVQSNVYSPHLIAGLKVKRAKDRGAEVLVLNSFNSLTDDLASFKADPGDDLSLLRQILKAVTELSPKSRNLPGYEELIASLSDVEVGDTAKIVAEKTCKAKKAIILFEQNKVSTECASLLGMLALCAGHGLAPRSGVIQMKPGANGQGLADQGVKDGEKLRTIIADGSVKGLVIFGEDIKDFDRSNLEFLAVQDLAFTDTARQADIVFPARSFAESEGTYTNSVGKTQSLRKAVDSPVAIENTELLRKLSATSGYVSRLRTQSDLEAALRQQVVPAEPVKLIASPNAPLNRVIPNTNALYNSLLAFAIAKRL